MEEDLDAATLLDENLWKIVETKLMFINDPDVECKVYLVSRPIVGSQIYTELNMLLEQMGKVKFSQNSLWKTKTKLKNDKNLDLHRDVDIQLQEVLGLLEKFSEKVEENEEE